MINTYQETQKAQGKMLLKIDLIESDSVFLCAVTLYHSAPHHLSLHLCTYALFSLSLYTLFNEQIIIFILNQVSFTNFRGVSLAVC